MYDDREACARHGAETTIPRPAAFLLSDDGEAPLGRSTAGRCALFAAAARGGNSHPFHVKYGFSVRFIGATVLVRVHVTQLFSMQYVCDCSQPGSKRIHAIHSTH